MKNNTTYISTDNSTVYNRVRKIVLENDRDIFCGICPYHKCSNRADPIKSWKNNTKVRKQWARHTNKLNKEIT